MVDVEGCDVVTGGASFSDDVEHAASVPATRSRPAIFSVLATRNIQQTPSLRIH
jgi:hypothetical protein